MRSHLSAITVLPTHLEPDPDGPRSAHLPTGARRADLHGSSTSVRERNGVDGPKRLRSRHRTQPGVSMGGYLLLPITPASPDASLHRQARAVNPLNTCVSASSRSSRGRAPSPAKGTCQDCPNRRRAPSPAPRAFPGALPPAAGSSITGVRQGLIADLSKRAGSTAARTRRRPGHAAVARITTTSAGIPAHLPPTIMT